METLFIFILLIAQLFFLTTYLIINLFNAINLNSIKLELRILGWWQQYILYLDSHSIPTLAGWRFPVPCSLALPSVKVRPWQGHQSQITNQHKRSSSSRGKGGGPNVGFIHKYQDRKHWTKKEQYKYNGWMTVE